MYVDHARFGQSAGLLLDRNVARLSEAAAQAFEPPPRLKVSAWAEAHRRFPEEDAFPGPWKNDTAPELVEIMDALTPEDPCEEVTLIKCAQSGGSASAENFIGYVADLHPGPMLFVQATAIAAKNWAKEKFWPMVASSPRLDPDRGGAIRPLGLKDGTGSDQRKIRFRKATGYVLLSGANSAADLRQRTVRYAIEDDLDQFPDDLANQGSPESMIDARLKVWRSRRLSKRLKISTPTIKGASKIGTAYANSDRRRYYMKCCHCGDRFELQWSDIIWPDGEPEQAVLSPPCCGAQIENWRKPELKRSDGWLSVMIDGEETPRLMDEDAFQALRARMMPSVKRGFHLEGMISTFQSWGDMAAGFVAALGDEALLKTWANLVRGVEYEIKGGRPDHDKLKVLRDDRWGHGPVPAGVIVTTMGADVQADGIYYEVVGWGPNWESWQIDAGFLPGATDIEGDGAWKSLHDYSERGVRYPGGVALPIDQECVDAGYHTGAARAYCELSARRLPVFGRAGWDMPVLGRGEAIRYDQRGKRAGKAGVREEDRAYLVGTFGIKLSWYGLLRESVKWHDEVRTIADDGELPPKPKGLVNIGRDVPEDWFEQVTAEAVTTQKKGMTARRIWTVLPGRQNHYLDCRTYNRAAAEKLMLHSLGPEDWDRLRMERHNEPRREAAPKSDAAAKPTINAKRIAPTGGFVDAGDHYL